MYNCLYFSVIEKVDININQSAYKSTNARNFFFLILIMIFLSVHNSLVSKVLLGLDTAN